MHDRAEEKAHRVLAGLPSRMLAGVTVVCMIGAVVAGGFAFSSSRQESFSTAYAQATFLFGLVGLLSALGCFLLFRRGMGADRVIVWLRRFHQHEPTRFPLPRFMSMLGTANFEVVTIQDSRFRYSYQTGVARSLPKLITFQVALVVPAFLVGLFLANGLVGWLEVSAEDRALFTPLGAMPLTLLIANLVFAPVALLAIRRAGVEVIRDDAGTPRIAQWMDRVQSGRGHVIPGLKIFKCGDDFWMNAVATMLQKCDAAIIDVSDLNENMRWELSQCTANVRSDKLILAYGVPPENYPTDPPDALVDEIEHLIGADRLQQVIFWPYPEPFAALPLIRFNVSPLELQVLEFLLEALKLALDGTASDNGGQLDGEAATWRRYFSVSQNQLGAVAEARGDLAEAKRRYQTALEIAERLAALDPSNTDCQRDLSVCHDQLGALAEARGDLPEAARRYHAALEITQRLVASDPTNTEWQAGLSGSQYQLGVVAEAQGDLAEAERRYQAALEITERLVALDPTNTEWQDDLSVSQNQLGAMAEARGDLPEAARRYQAAAEVVERLVALDPSR